MERSAILILDPRGNISLGGKDVINRHLEYAKILYSKSDKHKLVVFSTSYQDKCAFYSKFMNRYNLSRPTFNPVFFSWRAYRRLVKEKIDVRLIIASDPWESFWTGFILAKMIGGKVPIQMQIHGDIADPLWRKINWRNKFRFYLAKCSCSRATSIRAVGQNQKNNLMRVFSIRRSKITIIPVPINPKLISFKSREDAQRPKSIAFVGRIHQDRGIWDFLELLNKLSDVSKDFDVIIIGSGKAESKFLTRARLIIPRERLQILGQLSQESLAKMWNKTGVLASLAPAESYGRVMREALISGVPIWAAKSSGALDLISELNSKSVRLIDLNSSSKALLKEFESLIRIKPDYKLRNKLVAENKSLSSVLVNSWLNLVKN